VVAIISYRLWSGERAVLFGHGKPSRDYVHVTDVADALVRASGTRGVFNISSGREVPVQEIFDLISSASGIDREPELAPLREGELERSCMDPSAAAEQLGWKAQISLEDGIAETYRALIEEFEAGQA
jgi:UDP-glucose 4-epimerase